MSYLPPQPSPTPASVRQAQDASQLDGRDAPRGPLSRLGRSLASYLQSIEATPLGALALNRIWPAYFFALVLAAKVNALVGSLPALMQRAAEQGPLDITAWLVHQSLTAVLLVVVVVLFVVRRPVVGARSSLVGAVVAIAGTFGLVLLGTADTSDQLWTVLAAGSLLIFAGTVFAIASLLTLRRSFGLFPEARALVTAGPYRWVRHPVYLGEIVAAVGLVLPAPSLRNLVVFAVFCGLQYWRALNEERALEASFPEYHAYAERTRRLVPWPR